MRNTWRMPDHPAHRDWQRRPEVDRESWGSFRSAAAVILAQLDVDLQQRHGIGYADFDALVQLSLADEGGTRMADLARAVHRSPSALTRLVSRLETRHLVQRHKRCSTDVTVTITADGLALLAEAIPAHLDLVDRLFWAHLTVPDRETMARLCGAILGEPQARS
jgi:DNA-binding MarR family transcriptional regulator